MGGATWSRSTHSHENIPIITASSNELSPFSDKAGLFNIRVCVAMAAIALLVIKGCCLSTCLPLTLTRWPLSCGAAILASCVYHENTNTDYFPNVWVCLDKHSHAVTVILAQPTQHIVVSLVNYANIIKHRCLSGQ